MLKKVAVVAAGVIAALFMLSHTKVGSYAGTAWGKIRTSAKQQVPVEFEIDRLRHEVVQLVPDMKKNRSIIAEEMVAIENLKEEIAATRVRLEEHKAVLLKLTKDVDSGETTFVYRRRAISRERLAEKLARDLQSYKRAEAELKTREQVLDAKERALDAAKEQLAAMRDQKQDLEVQIAQLEAEMKNVRLAQTRCKFQLDDSRLAEIKRSLADLRNRLKVEKTQAELEGEFANDPIEVSNKVRPVSDVTREVREYFQGGDQRNVAVEKK